MKTIKLFSIVLILLFLLSGCKESQKVPVISPTDAEPIRSLPPESHVTSDVASEISIVSEAPSQVSTNQTPSTNNDANITDNTGAPNETTNKISVKQVADPNTGISWDGVSPIIYTYEDGTTGTEKRDGATFERLPGVFGTVTVSSKVEYSPYCNYCGKLMGDGTNGTCVRWLMCDVVCPQCNTKVPVHTCHTCGE